jgi:hypothetical protein
MGAYEQPFVAGATKGCFIEGWGRRALIPRLPAGRGEGLTVQIQTTEDFLQWTALSSDFALLRQSHQSHQAVSSLCRNPRLGRSSTDYPFTSSCSPPRVATTQLLSVSGGKLRHGGTLTLLCTLTLKRTEASR